MWKIYGYRSPEQKWYVGSTELTLKQRAGKNGCKYSLKCPVFRDAISKFGWDSLEPNILRLCETKEEADYWEKHYIREKNSLFPNGYNLQDGGQSAKAHEFSKQKMSKSQTGRKHTPEELKKMSDSNRGRVISLRNRQAVSLATSKSIRQYSREGQFIAEYPSMQVAATAIGRTKGAFYASMKSLREGKSKTAYNSLWEIA